MQTSAIPKEEAERDEIQSVRGESGEVWQPCQQIGVSYSVLL